MRDPYSLLGLSRTADAEAIKRAYRRLVKEYHPDRNPGDTLVEQHFKDIAAAYALLSDPEQRARYDRGEIDAAGRPRAEDPFRRASRGGAERDAARGYEEMFTRGGFRARGTDLSYTLEVDFLEAAAGARKRLTLSDGSEVEVTVPPGTEDGRTLRLKGRGLGGLGGGPTGDAYVEIRVAAHPFFTVRRRDVHLEVPVTLKEAVLGASIEVPTLDGKVAVRVPPGASGGTTLRLKGKGLRDPAGGAAGDQYVRLRIVLPDPPDPELDAFVARWQPKGAADPRRKAGMT